jgi:thiosulfate dehydrogenase
VRPTGSPPEASRPGSRRSPLGGRALGLVVLAACGGEISGAERGAELFESTSLSPSEDNRFACATCHSPEAGARPSDGDPGYRLHGAINRPSYWGGDYDRLEDAVDACLRLFMRGAQLDPEAEDFHALYEYLLEISPPEAPAEPFPLTIVENVVDVERGDAGRGAEVYDASCRVCHGAAFSGDGSILEGQYDLPAVTAGYDSMFPGVDPSLVVIEKVRHGRFFEIGVDMPLFTLEAMSDEDLGALLAYLEL